MVAIGRGSKYGVLSRHAAIIERVILALFATVTLFMPLLYLQVNNFIVAAVGLIVGIALLSDYQHRASYVRIRRIVTKHPVLILGIVALLTRLLWVAILSQHTNQVSDFLDIYNDSLQEVPSSRHVPNWTHFITFPYILHFLVAIFGSSMLVGTIVNAVVNSISVVLVYLLGTAVASKRIGFAAAAIMILWPSMGAFTSIYAPDHLTILFLLLSILCFIMFIQSKITRVKIGFMLACIGSLWALGFFKDLAPILVVSFALVVGLIIIRDGQFRKNITNAWGTVSLCVFVAFGTITHVPIISAIAHQPVNPSLVPYFLYIGLGGNNTGSWQPEIMDHYNQLIDQNSQNYNLANKVMLHEALHNVKQRLAELPTTIWNKSRTVQANDEAKVFWVEESADAAGSKGLKSWLGAVVQPINGIFFAGIILLMCASVYFFWKERMNAKLTLLVIVSIGYSLLLLIIEAQNRYRYIIEPLYCIFAAYGLVNIYYMYLKAKSKNTLR